ncbi:MAG: bifunctional diguanylate cyclase/phosphodiesterase [Aquificae bacterium]|nr:bifunctional diguanylate cyclase/phosphodiesterase [Aquificota bacterium]
MAKKFYLLLEKIGFKNYSTKVLFFFSIIFLIAFFITETIFVIYQFKKEKNLIDTGLYNATKIRASLIEQRLEKLKATLSTIYYSEENIKKLLRLQYVTGILFEGKKYGLFPECKLNFSNYKFCKKENIILIRVKRDFIVAVKKYLIEDILSPKEGMVSLYSPEFYLGIVRPQENKICVFYKIKNSNLGVSGCVDKFEVFKSILLKNIAEGTLFFTIFIIIGYIFLKMTNRIILYPINSLKEKVITAKIQGIDKVEFYLEGDVKDEFGKLALLMEEMRLSILRYQNQMDLVMETTSKMVSITNDIEKFTKFVIDNLESIFTYVIGNVVYIDDYYEVDKKLVIFSKKFQKNNIKEDSIKEILAKAKENELEIFQQKGKYILTYKKNIENSITIEYGLVSRIEISERDLKYINIVISHLIYSIHLIHLANYDGLTRVLNRRAVIKKAQMALEEALKKGESFSLIILDLDDFKSINDTYGHIVGDEVLKKVSSMLRDSFGKRGIVGRLGGEEFIVVLPNTSLEDAVILARNFQEELKSKDMEIEDYVISVTASFGVAGLNEHGKDLYELIRAADISLYKAKREGKDQVISLDRDSLDMLFIKEFKGRKELEKALSKENIVPFFQPIFSTETKEILGYEALARIKSNQGFIPAEKFIKDIIKFGLSEKLDFIIQEKVLKTLAEKNINKKIFINLSKTYIHDLRNIDKFLNLCREYNIDTKNIIFEITEEEAIVDVDIVRKFILIAKEKGISFALDDFGAGYSTFSYIKHFNIDYIKIDGSLIKRIHRDRDKQIILEGIVHISKNKGIKTIAEKVESYKDFITLRFVGVDYVQGYFLSKPSPNLEQDYTFN